MTLAEQLIRDCRLDFYPPTSPWGQELLNSGYKISHTSSENDLILYNYRNKTIIKVKGLSDLEFILLVGLDRGSLNDDER